MEAYNGIAPAHNPPYVNGVRRFAQRLPGIPLVGLFETAFYQWAPEAAMRYAVPESWHKQGVRRWGFHGASHKYVAERAAELLGRDDVAARVRNLYVDKGRTPVRQPSFRMVSCHLGGSSSVTGILNGVGIGNSLGMSPQSGLPHNNRVGDLDSMALPLMLRQGGLSLDEAERQLCKESGLKGLSGGFNDMRDLVVQAQQGNAAAQLAIEVLIHQVRHWVGSFLLQLNGLDVLVFTAGIAENNADLRAAICKNLDQLGIVLDPARNAQVRASEAVISREDSRVRIMVIPTNEELVIAREVKRHLLKEKTEI
jgi:acetate kinase